MKKVLLAAACVGVLSAGEARGELRAGMGWGEMVEELRREVMTGAREVGVSGVVMRGGGFGVVGAEQGETTEVEIGGVVKAAVREAAKREEVVAVCSVHTHPVRALVEAGVLHVLPSSGAVLPYAPPSAGDVGDMFSDAEKQVPHRQGVADARGMWYYERATEDERKAMLGRQYVMSMAEQEALLGRMARVTHERVQALTQRELEGMVRGIVRAELLGMYEVGKRMGGESALRELRRVVIEEVRAGNAQLRERVFAGDAVGKTVVERVRAMEARFLAARRAAKTRTLGMPTKAEWEGLQKAYVLEYGTLVRHVAYEEVAGEPPCAGARYVREQ